MSEYLTLTAWGPKAARNTEVRITGASPTEESGVILRLENSAGDECSISIGAEDAKALTSAIHTLTSRY